MSEGREGFVPNPVLAGLVGVCPLVAAVIVGIDRARGLGGCRDRMCLLEHGIADLNSPQASLDAGEVDRIGDLLVPEELRPSAVRAVGEILAGALPCSVPAGRRLGGGFPEEREA